MEDFLYVLAIIAWVAYSFFKNSQKVKKNRPVTRKPMEETPENRRDVRSFLEELLGDAETKPPEPMPESVEPIPALEYSYKQEYVPMYVENYQEKSKEEYFSHDNMYEETGIMPSQYQLILESTGRTERILAVNSLEEKKETPRWQADIRNAVIMAEILRRPYDEKTPQEAFWLG